MACKITNSFAIKKIFHPTFSKTYKKSPFLLLKPTRQSPSPKGREWKKNEHSFSSFSPTRRTTKGSQPSHPRIPTSYNHPYFYAIHPKTSDIPFWSCPLWTSSLTLPQSSLKCWQKSNPGIHRKCFRCFKCFGCFRCFMFAFGPENRPVLVQIRTKPTNR